MMTKQTIEIDVPEGYEIDLISKSTLNPGKEIPYFDITVYLKKEELKYIEVREYLFIYGDGHILIGTVQKDLGDDAATRESSPHFIRWIDNDWRKIYI